MSNAINKLIPPKLEPCPHCGAEPIMKPREHNVSYIVICWRCGLNGPTDELGVQPCADSWNRLSRAARLLAAVEGLETTLCQQNEYMSLNIFAESDGQITIEACMDRVASDAVTEPTLADALIGINQTVTE